VPPRLSICIPTHHGRCGHLEELLREVLAQASLERDGDLEICVTDNASDDGTAEMVPRIARGSPVRVDYWRHDSDVGAVRNIFAVVQRAAGEYCWVLGSDDGLEPGAIASALAALDRAPHVTGITVGFRVYSATMAPVDFTYAPEIFPDDRDTPRRYSGARDAMHDLGVLLAYMSVHIVRRADWVRVLGEDRVESALNYRLFGMALHVGRVLAERPDWLWLPAPLVKNRSGNAVVAPEEAWKYHVDASRELIAVWRELLHDTQLERTLLWRWYFLTGNPDNLLACKLAAVPGVRTDVEMVFAFLHIFWRLGPFWRFSLPLLLTPSASLAADPSLRERRLRRWTGRSRRPGP
jgi:glycosyltransferase involved in cell wall biosynthesis